MVVSANFRKGSQAGVKIRLVEKIIKQLNTDLLKYVPIWNQTLNLPTEYDQELTLFNYTTKIVLYDIQSEKIEIDLQKFQIDFRMYDYTPVIEVSFPLI